MRPIPYEMTPSAEVPALAARVGKVLSLNISSGGMLVLMDQPPEIGQVLRILVPTPILESETPTLAEVRWTRRMPFEQPDGNGTHFVGLRFMFC
jgi:hypothetical protein